MFALLLTTPCKVLYPHACNKYSAQVYDSHKHTKTKQSSTKQDKRRGSITRRITQTVNAGHVMQHVYAE